MSEDLNESALLAEGSDGGNDGDDVAFSETDIDDLLNLDLDGNEHDSQESGGKPKPSAHSQMLSVFEEINASQGKSSNDSQNQSFMDESDLSQEKEEERRETAMNEKRSREAKARQEKNMRRIRYSPPGLKLFRKEYFRFFKRKNLDLERDFGYTAGRERLREKMKLKDEQITEIYASPIFFVTILSPETTSILIRDKDDYCKICDYLFFAIVSTKSFNIAALFKQALMSLLKNYGYESWMLGIRHVLPSLLNLGMEVSVLLEASHMFYFLESRLKAMDPNYQGNQYPVKDKYFPEFFRKRYDNPDKIKQAVNGNSGANNAPPEGDDSDSELMENDDPSSLAHTKIAYVDAVEEKDEDADDDQVAPYLDETPEEYKCDSIQILAIQRLVSMTSDLITTFPKQSSLVPQKDSTDWIESLILFYYFASVAADWHLIMDSEIRNDIKTAFRCMIDAFSIRHWKGLPPGAPDENGSLDDVNTVANDITEAIAAVAMFDGFENYRVWDPNDVPNIGNLPSLDHHHNLASRVSLLPPTFRGNMIRKMVAFMYLQHILNTDHFANGRCHQPDGNNITLTYNADAVDTWKLIKENKARLDAFKQEYYVMMSILRILDAIVGNEPFVDFKKKKFEDGVSKLQEYLTVYLSTLKREVIQESDAARVVEFVERMNSKWKILRQDCIDGKQQNLHYYVKRKNKAGSEIESSQSQEI